MRLQDCLFNPPHVIAQGLGYSTKLIDGNSVRDVYSAVLDTLEYSSLPEFIECQTYRLCGHVGPDDLILGEHIDIRPDEEVADWQMKDPLLNWNNHLSSADYASIRDEVRNANKFAKESRFPDSNTLENYVYADQVR
jgi:TPP-dependent pyruvate/acetoin dehydrogenase alpha subunit